MANLKIKIGDLVGANTGVSADIKIAAKIPSPDPENFKIKDKIIGRAFLTKIENGILADFDLKTKIGLACSRCLKKIDLPLRLKFQQEFSLASGKQPNPDIQYTIEQDEVDILPSVQQEILLAIPMKPLCKKKCKGIK